MTDEVLVHIPKEWNVPVFQLLQWKYAIKLEQKGMRHSSGRSVRKHAAVSLGLKPNAKADWVIQKIDQILATARRIGTDLDRPPSRPR